MKCVGLILGSLYKIAKANLAVGEASVEQNKAAVVQSQEIRKRAQRNLYASEEALVQSDGAVDTELSALYKALGGGWQ